MHRTITFVTYMDDENVELIHNLERRSREIDIGVRPSFPLQRSAC